MLSSYLPVVGLLVVPVLYLEVFTDPFTTPKWVAVHFFAALSLFTLKAIPRLGRAGGFLVGVVALYLASMLINRGGPYLTQTLDWLSFAAIALAAGQVDRATWYRFNRQGTWLVIAFALAELLAIGPWQGRERTLFLSSTFGFQNLTAEFLGVSLLLQTASLREERVEKKNLLLFGLTFFYFASLLSRAAFLALAVASLPFFAHAKKKHVLGAILVFVLGTGFAGWLLGDQLVALVKQKGANVSVRVARLGNTVALIKDHPWGVGPGNYEFAYIPYREAFRPDAEVSPTLLPRSPHNGYLEAIAEGGWLFGVALFTALAAIALRLKGLLLSLFLFLSVDALFAFPLETGYPFFVAALLVGSFLRKQFEMRSLAPWISKVGAGSLLILALGYAGNDFILATQTKNPRLITGACLLWDDWRSCAQKAELELGEDPSAALATARKITEKNPLNYFGWDLQRKAGCRLNDWRSAEFARERYEEIWERGDSRPVCAEPTG